MTRHGRLRTWRPVRAAALVLLASAWCAACQQRPASSGLQFGSPNQDEQRGIKYVIDAASPLFGIKSQLESFALGHFGASGSTLTPALPPAEYKWLRQHYLHLSWSDRLGFEFRRDAQGQPTRLILAG